MSMYKNLTTFAAVAVLGLGLAACGGGGSSSPTASGGGGGGPQMCPEGQVGSPPNCMMPEPPGPTPEQVAAMTKAAETKLDAIDDINGANGLGNRPDSEVPSQIASGSYGLAVKRDRMATTATVTVYGATAAANKKFMANDLGDGLSMHTLDGEMGMQEIAMVMTDIEAPKAVKFAEWESGADGATPYELNADAEGANASGNAAVAYNLLGVALDSGTPAQKTILDNMMSSAFSAPGTGVGSVTHTFVAAREDDTSTTAIDETRAAAMVPGTFNGAMGTYTCTGATDCTVTVNAKGELTSATVGWIFTPAEGAMSDQPDYDYLNYGFWLKKTVKDGVTTYNNVAPFAMAVGMDNSTGAITGSASYEGSAVGIYVHNVLSAGGGQVESRTAGHFTADANLMAYFGQPASPNDNIPPNKLNTLTGTINNFELSGGEDQDWSVALKGNISTTDFSIEMGTANGGGAPGTLTGQFYGASAEEPDAATGEFNANFSNGSVAGAFGVRKKE